MDSVKDFGEKTHSGSSQSCQGSYFNAQLGYFLRGWAGVFKEPRNVKSLITLHNFLCTHSPDFYVCIPLDYIVNYTPYFIIMHIILDKKYYC